MIDSSISAAGPRSRHLPLPGTFNVRDLGGYATHDGRQTRWGVFFRADSLHALPAAGQAALIDRGLRTVVDLRNPMETEHWPNVFAPSAQVRYVNLPLNTATPPADPNAPRVIPDLQTMNRRYLDSAQREVAAVLRALAAAQWPALVQCQAGKDRTGLIVALVLGAAGVPYVTIAEDYALTATFLTDGFYIDMQQQASRYGIPWEDYQKLLVCPPEIMLNTLTYIDERYGGVEPYLSAIGLTESDLATLRNSLLE